MTDPDAPRTRAEVLHLHGLLAHWNDVVAADWLPRLRDWEEHERRQRSLERRLKDARIGAFKPLCDFDWSWPMRPASAPSLASSDSRPSHRRMRLRGCVDWC